MSLATFEVYATSLAILVVVLYYIFHQPQTQLTPSQEEIDTPIVQAPGRDHRLDAVLYIPWDDRYVVNRSTIDITDMRICANPFADQARATPSTEIKETYMRQELVVDERSYERFINATAAAHKGLSGRLLSSVARVMSKIDIGAVFSRGVQQSETTFTYILLSITTYNDHQADRPALTPEARALLATDPEEFANVYGQYYVAGHSSRSIFVAVIRLSAASSEIRDQAIAGITSSIAASADLTKNSYHNSGMGTGTRTSTPTPADIKSQASQAAAAVLAFERTIKKFRLNVECECQQIGFSGSSDLPATISQVFTAYQAHMKGRVAKPFEAALHHFSYAISPTFPQTVKGVSEQDFSGACHLNHELEEASFRIASHPDREVLEADFYALCCEVRNSSQSLVRDRARRESFFARLRKWQKVYEQHETRRGFMRNVVKERMGEPREWQWTGTATVGAISTYGLIGSGNSLISQDLGYQAWDVTSGGIIRLSCLPPGSTERLSSRMIVGYTVHLFSKAEKGGSWKINHDPLASESVLTSIFSTKAYSLGKHTLNFQCDAGKNSTLAMSPSSAPGNVNTNAVSTNSKWRVTLYWVPTAKYTFEQLVV